MVYLLRLLSCNSAAAPKIRGMCEALSVSEQTAVYNGKIVGSRHLYVLDDHHEFQTGMSQSRRLSLWRGLSHSARTHTGKPVLVCGNTASMLSETWLARYFRKPSLFVKSLDPSTTMHSPIIPPKLCF